MSSNIVNEFKNVFKCPYYITYKCSVTINRIDRKFYQDYIWLTKNTLINHIKYNPFGWTTIRVVKVRKEYLPLSPTLMYKILAIACKYNIDNIDYNKTNMVSEVCKKLLKYYDKTKDEKFREKIIEAVKLKGG